MTEQHPVRIGGRQVRGAHLKDIWLEDPLGRRRLQATELPLTVVAPVPWFPFQSLLRLIRPHFRPDVPRVEVQQGVTVLQLLLGRLKLIGFGRYSLVEATPDNPVHDKGADNQAREGGGES